MADFREHYAFLIGVGIYKANRMVGGSLWLRVVKRDGMIIPVDDSYKENRLNVETEQGKITKLVSVG